MKIDPLWKQIVTEKVLKTAVRFPSRWLQSPQWARQGSNQLSRIFSKNSDVQIRKIQLAGLSAEEFKPSDEANQMLIHLHGGSFFFGSMQTHRGFLSHLCARTQAQILHVDYPLAPETKFPDALEQLVAFYHHLLGQGFDPKNLFLSGDSSGANLALALALRLRDENLPQVAGLVLMSPWLDLTLSGASLRFNQTHDAMLSIECLAIGTEHYLHEEVDRGDARVSPLFDDLSGLPPTLVQVGSKEILLDDAQRFAHRAQGAGVDVSLKIYTGMWHDFMLFHQWFEEGQRALADVGQFLHALYKD